MNDEATNTTNPFTYGDAESTQSTQQEKPMSNEPTGLEFDENPQAADGFAGGGPDERIEHVCRLLAAGPDAEAAAALRDLHKEWRNGGRFESLKALGMALLGSPEAASCGDLLDAASPLGPASRCQTLILSVFLHVDGIRCLSSVGAEADAVQALELASSLDDMGAGFDARRTLAELLLVTPGSLDADIRAQVEAMLKIARAGHEAEPGDWAWLRRLAAGHFFSGRISEKQGDIDGALQCYEACLGIAARMSEADPGDTALRRDVYVGHIFVGNLLERNPLSHADALRHYETGLEAIQGLAALDPDNALWRRDAYLVHAFIGRLLEKSGDPASALPRYKAAFALCREQAALDPANRVWEDDLIFVNGRFGRCAAKVGEGRTFRDYLEEETA